MSGRDVLTVLPTGAGKSLIFQLAAELLEGPVVVVSPLIALMRDQIDSLEEVGVEAARIDSSRGDRVRRREAARLASGEVRIAYCTPEQLEDDAMAEALAGARPALLAVDEAHALSHWGRSFRPAFLGVGAAAERLGRPPILALTATAGPWVREDIVDTLRMRDPATIVRGIDRPELRLEVTRVERVVDELRAIGRLLVGDPGDPGAPAPLEGKGIVYTRTTRAARETARWLRDRGVAADYYHGRRSARDRERVQEAFDRGEVRVVVATNAFGLGVDVPDVRFVIHRHAPGDLEAYWQEAGRAGRDGAPARCVLVYRPAALGQAAFMGGTPVVTREDVAALAEALAGDGGGRSQRALAEAAGMSAGRVARAVELLEDTGLVARRRGRVRAAGPIDPAAVPLVDEARREAYEESRIDVMRAYCETDGCRREFVLNFFGEELAERCGNCDNDDRPPDPAEATEAPPGIVVGAAVRHPAFGRGTVQHVGDGAITVMFDDEGYRSLSAELVAEEGLLRPE